VLFVANRCIVREGTMPVVKKKLAYRHGGRGSTFFYLLLRTICTIVALQIIVHFFYAQSSPPDDATDGVRTKKLHGKHAHHASALESRSESQKISKNTKFAQVTAAFTLPSGSVLAIEQAHALFSAGTSEGLRMIEHLDSSFYRVELDEYPHTVWPAPMTMHYGRQQANVGVSDTLSVAMNGTALLERKHEIMEILSRLAGIHIDIHVDDAHTADDAHKLKQHAPTEKQSQHHMPPPDDGHSRSKPPTGTDIQAKNACEGGSIESLVIQTEFDGEPEITPDNEAYVLIVWSKGAFIQAASVWGALHGIRTFAGLVQQLQHSHDDDNKEHDHQKQKSGNSCSKFIVAPVYVHDRPRFAHRGFLLDTAHVFMPACARRVQRSDGGQKSDGGQIGADSIDDVLFFASAVKMNVFHWYVCTCGCLHVCIL
jgi:hypothetical protein